LLEPQENKKPKKAKKKTDSADNANANQIESIGPVDGETIRRKSKTVERKNSKMKKVASNEKSCK
jgi:hypothetical protein